MPLSRFFSSTLPAWGVLLLLLSSCAPSGTPAPSPSAAPSPSLTAAERPGWVLAWQDEFDGDAVDPGHWAFETGGGGWGNGEWEFYTGRPENARIEEGTLVIEARVEKYLHRDYTSARLKTQNLMAFTYGRVEARMRLPDGKGIWPAFWMLGSDIESAGWPACGEIDIMEHLGHEPDRVYGTVHGPGYSGGNSVGSHTVLADGSFSDGFHLFAVEWEPGEIRWYADEEEYFRVDPGGISGEWVFDHPFFIILNLAVGGAWPGYPDETTVFPQFLRVDYVRVYQRPGEAGEIQGPPGVMHVDAVALSVREGTSQVEAAVTVTDGEGRPVEGAEVAGGWVGAVIRGQTRGETDATGIARILSDPVTRAGEVTFCVIGVTHPGFTYDEAANRRTCGKIER